MPDRISSLAFWAIFAGIVIAVAYPTIDALRNDQPQAAASPAAVPVAARSTPGAPWPNVQIVAAGPGPGAKRAVAPAVQRTLLPKTQRTLAPSAHRTSSPVRRGTRPSQVALAVRSPGGLPWPYSQAFAESAAPHTHVAGRPSQALPWPYSQAFAASAARHTPGAAAHTSAASRKPAAVAMRGVPIAPLRRWYNDSDFAFSGRWEHVRGQYDGRTSGSSSRSFHPGSQASLSFTGESVRLYGIVGPGGGLGVVTIDGRLKRLVRFYAPVKSVHKLVYSSPPLGPGPHKLSISVLADPTLEATRARYVNLGGADV